VFLESGGVRVMSWRRVREITFDHGKFNSIAHAHVKMSFCLQDCCKGWANGAMSGVWYFKKSESKENRVEGDELLCSRCIRYDKLLFRLKRRC